MAFNEMKYVVVKCEGNEQLFIFPKGVDHDKFAEVLSNIRVDRGRDWERKYREPISAGFTDGVECYGKSETLGLASRKDVDTKLLKYGGQS
jgi:hypothetical protein